MNKEINIATILPYKENYTFSKAAAASLWVSEFYKYSRFKKTNYIYGSTDSKDYLSKNYININVNNLRSKLSSSTIEYCKQFIKISKKFKFDLIEIHNRPLVYFYLGNRIKSKYILYFHNDPLSMKGSKTVSERQYLINNVDKIIFVSKWVQKKFFYKLDQKLINKTEVIYPSIHPEKKLYKKQNRIVFVGKLNPSKGYDIYRDAITKILDEFKNWKAYSIGDESRNKPVINHARHNELGYLKHKEVLNFLKFSEIAVVPSRWEEPFGRTALESSSRGCATIISNRGGLPETTDYGVILDRLNYRELYNAISHLIKNPTKRKKLQKDGFNNVKHITKNNSKEIDNIRESLITEFKINYIKNKLRILNIYNLGQKLNHRLYNISLGKKFTNGFIRNGHDVLEISDRDFIKQNRVFGMQTVQDKFQQYLIETFKNYNPNFLFFGHTNNISLNTLDEFKKINKNLIVSQWNEDPIMPSLKDSKLNIDKILKYKNYTDHTFITTHPDVFRKESKEINNLHYLFIPVDQNIESYEVYKLKPRNDLFYAMSHGVNRAILKKGKIDNRIHFLNDLIKKMKNINHDFYGFENKQPVWGNEFYKPLINSKMGLNLSRGLPTKFYTSNRIASIAGNGILTFIDKKTELNKFFNNKEMVFYNNIDDLADKIDYYKKNDKQRREIASNGKKKYFKLFNERKITQYIIDCSIGKKSSLF